MIASKLISDGILPLKSIDTGRDALDYMEDLHIAHLPLVEDRKLIGLVSDNDIYRSDNLNDSVGNLKFSSVPFVYDYQHIFDALKLFKNYQLTLLPVLDEYDNYIGVITESSLIEYMADAFSVTEHGALIILEMGVNDYVLSEIARIVESNDAKILSLMIHADNESTKILVSIKINRMDAGAIIQTFNRFSYNIVGSFNDSSEDNLRDRFESFMKYLDI